MTSTHKWYALYTKPRWEKKVAELLKRKGIEHYCPLNKVVRQWSDRKKVVEEPLFTSYVFVKVTQADMLQVKETDGVINFVHWLGSPAVIRDEEIDTIKVFLAEFKNVKLERAQVNVSDTVQITHGPFMHHTGSVVEVLHKVVKVVLPSLGYAMVALVGKEHVEKVKVVNTGEFFGQEILKAKN